MHLPYDVVVAKEFAAHPASLLFAVGIAIAAGATFAARSIDVDVKHLEYVLERAAKHTGTAVVEIYQNCNIFNDGAFEYATDKTTKSETTIYLEQGKPLVFGKNADKGIRLREMNPEVVSLADTAKDDLLVHNEQAQPAVPFLLSRMRQPDLPEPMGILRDVQKERYVNVVRKQNEDAIAKQGAGDIQARTNGIGGIIFRRAFGNYGSDLFPITFFTLPCLAVIAAIIGLNVINRSALLVFLFNAGHRLRSGSAATPAGQA